MIYLLIYAAIALYTAYDIDESLTVGFKTGDLTERDKVWINVVWIFASITWPWYWFKVLQRYFRN